MCRTSRSIPTGFCWLLTTFTAFSGFDYRALIHWCTELLRSLFSAIRFMVERLRKQNSNVKFHWESLLCHHKNRFGFRLRFHVRNPNGIVVKPKLSLFLVFLINFCTFRSGAFRYSDYSRWSPRLEPLGGNLSQFRNSKSEEVKGCIPEANRSALRGPIGAINQFGLPQCFTAVRCVRTLSCSSALTSCQKTKALSKYFQKNT